MHERPRTRPTPEALARREVAHPGWTRPDWTTGVPRNPALLWLDRNENTDPVLADLNARIVADVVAARGAELLRTYPECADLYRKLAHYVGCTPDNLLIGAGSDGVIRSVFEAFIASDDVVMHTNPTFAMYPVYSSMYGARAEVLSYRVTSVGPVLTLEEILTRLRATPPKLLCLPNPDSPTGTAFTLSQLRSIIEAAGDAGAMVLIDEAYYPFHDETVAPWVTEYDHLIVARTFSKAWGFAGLRVGYAVAAEGTTRLLQKVRPMYEINTLAAGVIDRALDFVSNMEASVRRLNEGRDGFLDAMTGLGLPSIRAKGNFMHVAFGDRAAEVHRALETLVLYRQDGAGCLSGYSRFSATTSALFAPVIGRIQDVVATSPR